MIGNVEDENSEQDAKAWNEKGRNFGRVHLPLLSYVQMTPLGPFLYGEMMVIRLSEGIQEVKWLCNPK
jgi:hypothetical protein